MKHIMWVYFGTSLLTFFPALGSDGFAGCQAMFPGSVIPDPHSTTVQDVCKEVENRALFAIRYDTARKTPNWTAHRLTPELMAHIAANSGTMKRPKFTPDREIQPDDQAVDKSYLRSG